MLPDPRYDLEPDEIREVRAHKMALMSGPPKAPVSTSTPGVTDTHLDEYANDAPIADPPALALTPTPQTHVTASTEASRVVYQPSSDIFKRASTTTPIQYMADAVRNNDKQEKIDIIGPFGKVSFVAAQVCLNDYGVGFVIHRDSMGFEPNLNAELTVRWMGRELQVIYAGGLFTFKDIPFTFLSFIRLPDNGTNTSHRA